MSLAAHSLGACRFEPLAVRGAREPGEAPPAAVRLVREQVDAEPVDEAAVQREWSRLRGLNERLFDGPVVDVRSVRIEGGIAAVRWAPAGYRLLAVRPAVETGVRQLSVLALVRCGRGGGERVLLGRRAGDVHTYPGLWEPGPSGGVEPTEGELDEAELRRQLGREVWEELPELAAVARAVDGAAVLGLLHDQRVPSVDVVFDVRVPEGIEPGRTPRGWEYERVGWFARRQVAQLAERAERLSEPSACLLGAMGWG